MKARYEVTVAKNPILGAPKRTKVILRKSVCSVLVVISIFGLFVFVVVVGGASEASAGS